MASAFGQLRSATLVRPRLMAALDAAAAAPLTLVVAPAGYGKTTLLAQHAHLVRGGVGWLTVAVTDTTAAGLTDRLRAALPSPLPGYLIIDDLHLAAEAAAGTALDRLLAEAPPGLRLVVGSRRLPTLNLSRHELGGTVIIDADQLRFRTWEVERLLREVYGEPLPGDDVAALSRRVGGWAAGLKLFHLSTHGRPLAERRRAVAALDGRSALSRAYLARTVLADLPEPLRRFLVRTCVFDVVTADRCDELLGALPGPPDSQRRLEHLERRQAFTVSHDGGRTFAYHEVLRAHLLAELVEELGEDAARSWHARAARIVAARGATVEAARAYARAEDWPAVRRLLDRLGAGAADQGLDPWSDLLPAWFVAEDPWLVLAEARHRANHGQLPAAIAALRRAEAMFGTEPARARCRTTRAAVTAWQPGAPPSRTHWSGWLRAATRRYPAVVAAEAESLRDPAAPVVIAAAHLLAGDGDAAARTLQHAPLDDHTLPGLATRLILALLAVGRRDPAGGPALAAVAADAERAHLPWLERIAHAATALDGTEAGAKEARAVAEECTRLGDDWGGCLATALLLFGAAAGGRLDPADATDLLARARAVDSGVLVAWGQSLLALAAARAGLPDAELEVRRGESTARAAGVPGARVLALAAGAAAAGGRAEQLAAAYAAAAQAGLPADLVSAWTGGPGEPGAALPGAATDARLSLWCFGGFRLCVDGQPVDFSPVRPRVRTLVRILAMHAGRPVHRDTLIGALWPDTPTAQATRGLHVALSSLRTLLDEAVSEGGGRLVRRDGDAYQLALPPDGFADVVAFRAALAAAHSATGHARLRALRTAVQAYGGALLPEDGPAEWVLAEREARQRQAADAAAALAEAELDGGLATGGLATAGPVAGDMTAAGTGSGLGGGLTRDREPDCARAAAAAQRCVDIDPCHDAGWRLLIIAHRRAGHAAAAARARRDYAAVLASLGVDPAEADRVA
ncbi:winged helix-turn-helix domain-containing protein [Rhizomonospora bruguierae]|uniref:winged helix-turn-helix domain-containing protein n=1 Tax=Rhizomonospora bruguierae TaxID=1581705 RepID=UPI001BD0A6C8|nr:winged helix-turn-helix domain-containing protein [Micromonospora sp. NBRC 107566]